MGNERLKPEPITWRLHLASPPATVFSALATDQGRALFWAESAVERGGVIHFHFINGHVETSHIIESRAPELFVIEYFGSRVHFDLIPDGSGGTDLTMTNSGYDPAEREVLLPGWLNVLLPLKAAVDHGVDLRNHDSARTWDQNYVDQ